MEKKSLYQELLSSQWMLPVGIVSNMLALVFYFGGVRYGVQMFYTCLIAVSIYGLLDILLSLGQSRQSLMKPSKKSVLGIVLTMVLMFSLIILRVSLAN